MSSGDTFPSCLRKRTFPTFRAIVWTGRRDWQSFLLFFSLSPLFSMVAETAELMAQWEDVWINFYLDFGLEFVCFYATIFKRGSVSFQESLETSGIWVSTSKKNTANELSVLFFSLLSPNLTMVLCSNCLLCLNTIYVMCNISWIQHLNIWLNWYILYFSHVGNIFNQDVYFNLGLEIGTKTDISKICINTLEQKRLLCLMKAIVGRKKNHFLKSLPFYSNNWHVVIFLC